LGRRKCEEEVGTGDEDWELGGELKAEGDKKDKEGEGHGE